MGFVLGYDATAKRPLWSAQYLSAERVAAAARLDRRDLFHSEEQLPSSSRRDLTDFTGDNLDRGHLSPSADMPTMDSQYDSFSLANIVHQQPSHNRGIWREVEYLTRLQAFELQGAYVVTGAVYRSHFGVVAPKLGRGLSAPSFLYKAVYFDQLGFGAVYVSPNDDTARLAVIGFDEFSARFGIIAFPALAQNSVPTYPLLYPEEDEWQDYRFKNQDQTDLTRFSVDSVVTWFLALCAWVGRWVIML